MKQKCAIFLLSFSCLMNMASDQPDQTNLNQNTWQSHAPFWVPDDKYGHFSEWPESDFDRKQNDKLFYEARLKELDALLTSQLHLDETQIGRFHRMLDRSASLEPMIMGTPTLPTKVVIKEGEEPVVLSTKMVIACASVLNAARLWKGIWNFNLKQHEARIIEAHLAANPDPEVRKVTNEYGFYFTFDDK